MITGIAGGGTVAQVTDNAPAINAQMFGIAATQAPAQIQETTINEGIPPSATRWVYIPGRMMDSLDALTFGAWSIPANTFYPLRGVNYQNKRTDGSGTLVQISPASQVRDLKYLAALEPKKTVVDLLELSKLEDEQAQIRILQVLVNPKRCPKYAELNSLCATCHLKYLTTEAPVKIKNELLDTPNLAQVALDTLDVLVAAIEGELQSAALRINNALKQIDDPKSGKSQLFEKELADIYNTHRETPQYKTQVDRDSLTDKLLERIANTSGGLSEADVRRIVSEQSREKDALIARQAAEIEELKTQSAVKERKCGETGGRNAKGEPCGNTAKTNGRCASHPIGEDNG